MNKGLTTAAVGLVMAVSLSADAQLPKVAPTQSATERQALQWFEQSLVAYREGRFQDAVDLLKRAYATKPEAVLLYNLARAYEGMGADEQAIDAYSRYLDQDKEASDSESIRRRIETLRAKVAERQSLQRQRDEERKRAQTQKKAPTTPTESAELKHSPVPWVVVGVGAAGMVTGSVFGLVAQSKHRDAQDQLSVGDAQRLQDSAHSYATGANVAFLVGGVLTAAGLVWGIVDLTSHGSKREGRAAEGWVGVGVTPSALTFRGAF